MKGNIAMGSRLTTPTAPTAAAVVSEEGSVALSDAQPTHTQPLDITKEAGATELIASQFDPTHVATTPTPAS